MIGEPIFSMAVITLGLEVMIRTIAFDAVNVTPRVLGVPWAAETFMIGGAFIAWSYIAAIAMAAVAFVGVWLFFKTRTGVAMRATAFDQEAALAQGINVGRIFAIAWAAGALLAAVSGVFASMPPWGPAGMASRDGAFFAFRALPAVILGGLDSAVGALGGRPADRVRRDLRWTVPGWPYGNPGCGLPAGGSLHRDADRASRQAVRTVRHRRGEAGMSTLNLALEAGR